MALPLFAEGVGKIIITVVIIITITTIKTIIIISPHWIFGMAVCK